MSFYNMYGWNKTLMIPHQGNSLVTQLTAVIDQRIKKNKAGQNRNAKQNIRNVQYNKIAVYTLFPPLWPRWTTTQDNCSSVVVGVDMYKKKVYKNKHNCTGRKRELQVIKWWIFQTLHFSSTCMYTDVPALFLYIFCLQIKT